MLRRVLIAGVLLVLVAPAVSQQAAYFSVTSSRTYSPGEKASVQVYAHNVEELEFRVYRVNDPLLFFQKLEDLQGFGGRAPRLPQPRTALERFHSWKRGWRARIRDFFRAQFTADSRAAIRDWSLDRQREPVTAGPQATRFAQVPVLNPQQLVSTWRQPVRPGQMWESVNVPVQVPGKGLYVVEAVNGQLRAFTLLSVTDLGIVTKSAPGRVLAFLQDRTTGQPIADSPVFFWSNRREVSQQATDSTGVAEASFSEDRPEDALVLARRGDDFAVASLYAWYLSSDPNRYLTGYVYTDRPVYRPGHTVYFKGILRTQLGAEYRLPGQSEVQVEIQDADSKSVYRAARRLTANGTLEGEFTLPDTATLGYYSIIVRLGERVIDSGFHVEEYKKPEYEVRVVPQVRRVLQGESIQATIQARYYYGEPVARGRVTYVVHTSRHWVALTPDDEGPEEEDYDQGYYGGEQVLEQTAQLDDEGRLTVAIPTAVSDRKWDLRYRIEARVADAANREIPGHAFAVATYGSFQVRIRPAQYIYRPGEQAGLIVEARDYDGRGVATPFRVELHPWRWNQPEGAPLQQASGQTGDAGEARLTLALPQSGSFVAKVTARTPEGRDVEWRTYVWVAGNAGWYDQRRASVQIVPDKKSYRAGDVARVLIVTGVDDAHFLVTTEGRALHSRRVMQASGPAVTIEVPILPEYAPNFYVGVAFLHGNQLYQGAKKIKVPPVERQLQVEVRPSKDQFQPGEPALYTVGVRDHAGNPVPGAELSLGVVDEAIYAIRPDSAGDIVRFFYGESYNRVNTNSSLSYYFWGEAGRRAMQLARVRPRANLAQLKPERLVEPKIRKAFPDTVHWSARLVTDGGGRAQVRFSFPDSLTTWRATVRAVTRDTRVGSATNHTLVRKNLVLRLAVPRFFTEGDEVTLSALVHNYLSAEKRARVSLAAEGLEILEGETRDVAIPSGSDAQVSWRVRVKPGREVKLLGKALTNEESDALELTLPILPYGVKLAESRAGSVAERSGTASAELAFPPQSAAESRAMEIRVAPSLAGAVFGALDFLTGYPYGCTEQTMSRFLPTVVVAQASRELGLTSTLNEAELQKKVREGLQRLYDFQHEDGGWGWWQTDESHAFMTAYVLSGLSVAGQAGYPVDASAVNRARQWLRGAFDRERRTYADLRAYMAYALVAPAPGAAAGSTAARARDDAAILESVWQQRNDLTAYGVALLGLAMEAVNDPRAAQLAAQLETTARVDQAEAHWPLDRDTLMDFYGDATPEATAYAMKLLARQRPSSPLLPKAAAWLVNHRNEGYYWYSTKQTAMVIYGLTDYLKASGELQPDFRVTVWLNDRQIHSRQFRQADALAPASPVIRIPADQLSGGTNRVRIEKEGDGRLYWSARAEYFSTEPQLQRTGTAALNLLREYFRLAPEIQDGRIVYRLDPLQGALAPGDVIAVRLTVSGDDWRYLLIEDPIPAGAEFIERDDLYEIKQKPAWWNYWYSRREFHDDRAAIFQTYFRRGQTQHVYLLKVVNPGVFRVSPARVRPMYQPHYLATTEGKVVEVK